MDDATRNRTTPHRLARSRWAAIGAAVAVTLGAGGLVSVSAGTAESVFVAVSPTRVLDTRFDVGLPDAFPGRTSRVLRVTGSIPVVTGYDTNGSAIVGSATVVPAGATAIVANLTAVAPSARGFVSIRPGSATGIPSTSNINIPAPGVNIPNSVTVEVPTSGPKAGRVDLFYSATGATTHLLLDIVGYYLEGTGTPGPAGPAGPAGPTGPAGPAGPEGDPGTDAAAPARVLWVADDGTGDFTSVSAALASIDDASASNPYLVKIAPGTYTETSTLVMVDHVDLEGSGRGITTIECACSGGAFATNAVVNLSATAEVRDLTIVHPGGTDVSVGVYSSGFDNRALRGVVVSAFVPTGATNAFAVINEGGNPEIVDATLLGSVSHVSALRYAYGLLNTIGSPRLTDVDVVASASPSVETAIFDAAGGAVRLNDVYAYGADYALRLEGADSSVTDSELDGPIFIGGGVPSVLTVRGSTLRGVSATVGSVRVADSMVTGTVSTSGSGSVTCVGAYDSSLAPLDSTCN